jgi:hypothetical protein
MLSIAMVCIAMLSVVMLSIKYAEWRYILCHCCDSRGAVWISAVEVAAASINKTSF